VPLVVPEIPISFDKYIVPRGIQPGENPLPEDASESSRGLPPLNEAASGQLQEMGFSVVRAEKALRMTGNENAEIAMQWLFEHMDDPDIDVPFAPVSQQGTSSVVVDTENVTNLMGMGFDEIMAKKALQETVPLHAVTQLIL
jgi:ubiquitin carboxyl-terminal hydrolase 5/13